jgi:hypothetical protein
MDGKGILIDTEYIFLIILSSPDEQNYFIAPLKPYRRVLQIIVFDDYASAIAWLICRVEIVPVQLC